MSIALSRAAISVALLFAFLVIAGSGLPAAAAEFRANVFTNGDQGAPSAAPLGGGAFVAAWVSAAQDGSGFGVYARRFAPSGVLTEFRVNTTTIGDQAEPSVAMLSGGGFVIVWTSAHHPTFMADVYGQRYNASGVKVGGEFLVNTYRTYKQGAPAVAALPNNAFVVVWASENQDGSDYGVYGQRYAANGTKAGAAFRVNYRNVRSPIGPCRQLLRNQRFHRGVDLAETGSRGHHRCLCAAIYGGGREGRGRVPRQRGHWRYAARASDRSLEEWHLRDRIYL
jgi:hypothetical protein